MAQPLRWGEGNGIISPIVFSEGEDFATLSVEITEQKKII